MKKVLALLLAACMVFSFAACGEKKEEVKEEAKLIELKTSGQNVIQTAVPLIAGETNKTWEKFNLDVSRTHYVSGPPQLEANPAGDWSIGWIGATAAITGILNYDMQVVGLSGYDNSNMAFVRADSDLAKCAEGPLKGTLGTAADWKGKTILVGVGTVCYCDLMLTLNKLGLTENDVTIVNADISNGYQAFLAGNGDIFYSSSTYTTELLNNSAYKCCHTIEGMEAGMAGNIIVEKKWLAENEQVVVDYLTGALEILLWLNDDANQAQGAKWFTQVMKDEFGTEVSEDAALASEKLTGFRGLEFYEYLCQKQSSGLTGMQEEFGRFFDYHVQMGSREAKDRDTIVAAVDCSYLAKAIEQYKALHK